MSEEVLRVDNRNDESSPCCWKTSRVCKPNLHMCLSVFALRLQMAPKVSINSVVAILNVVRAVVQSVEALCYMPEGRGFDSRWCH